MADFSWIEAWANSPTVSCSNSSIFSLSIFERRIAAASALFFLGDSRRHSVLQGGDFLRALARFLPLFIPGRFSDVDSEKTKDIWMQSLYFQRDRVSFCRLGNCQLSRLADEFNLGREFIAV